MCYCNASRQKRSAFSLRSLFATSNTLQPLPHCHILTETSAKQQLIAPDILLPGDSTAVRQSEGSHACRNCSPLSQVATSASLHHLQEKKGNRSSALSKPVLKHGLNQRHQLLVLHVHEEPWQQTVCRQLNLAPSTGQLARPRQRERERVRTGVRVSLYGGAGSTRLRLLMPGCSRSFAASQAT